MYRFVATLFTVSLVSLSVAAESEPKPLKPINLAGINTAGDEDEPYLASNGLALYCTRSVKGRWDLFVSTRRTVGQAWPAGKDVDGWFDEKADNRGACLTVEGRYPQYLYFATNKDPERKDFRGDNFDVYVSVRQNAGTAFTAPTPVQGIASAMDEMHPWLTANAKELYFSRKTKEGWRVAVATGTTAGNYTNPKLLDLPVGYHHATLTADGKTMYLQGPLEKDRWGLFCSKLGPGGWGMPEPLEGLNSADAPTGDRSPALGRDGHMLYFASDRPGGKGGLDLWVVPTAQLAKTGK